MNENQKFEQIWGFRRNVDSSSDDSKSNSDAVKDQEKLGLVPENDGVSETNDPNVQVAKKPKRTRKSAPKKEKNKTEEVKTKPKKDSRASCKIKKGSNNSKKKKSKLISQMTVPDDFKIFTETILNDLRVARETMFSKMRKEMDQLVNPKPSRSIKKKSSENNLTKKTTPKPRVKKPKTTQAKPKQKNELATSKGLDHPQEQVNNGNGNGASAKSPILSNNSSKTPILNDNSPKNPILIDVPAKNPILIDASAKNPILTDTFPKNPILNDAMSKTPIVTNAPDQVTTSSYLTLPFPKSPILNDAMSRTPIFTNAPDQVTTSSYLAIPFVTPNSRPNNTSSTLESGNYYGLQTYRQNSTESSCFGNGYPVEFNHHQRMHNSNDFGIPSQVQGLSHDNLSSTRMMHGGGMRYKAGLSGHAFPNNLALNGFRNIYPN